MSSKLAVLLTTFNRKDVTLAGLALLHAALAAAPVQADIYLVDDGSTDGTAQAVARAFPHVILIRHAGGLYWCRGMHLAWSAALRGAYDAYLWMNDDIALFPDSVLRMLAAMDRSRAPGTARIVVGATLDPGTGRVSYGGLRRAGGWHPTKTALVPLSDQTQPCDTMNGNFVLVPAAVVARIGIVDRRFEHGMGDLDYGLRARRAGVAIVVCPGAVGTCARNAKARTFEDRSTSLGVRWRHMMSPKGLPPRSWLAFTRRHGGPLWPVLFLWPYVRVLASATLMRPFA